MPNSWNSLAAVDLVVHPLTRAERERRIQLGDALRPQIACELSRLAVRIELVCRRGSSENRHRLTSNLSERKIGRRGDVSSFRMPKAKSQSPDPVDLD